MVLGGEKKTISLRITRRLNSFCLYPLWPLGASSVPGGHLPRNLHRPAVSSILLLARILSYLIRSSSEISSRKGSPSGRDVSPFGQRKTDGDGPLLPSPSGWSGQQRRLRLLRPLASAPPRPLRLIRTSFRSSGGADAGGSKWRDNKELD